MSYHQLSYQGVINNVPEHERDIIIDIVEKLKTNSHVDNSALQRIYQILSFIISRGVRRCSTARRTEPLAYNDPP